jgi:hypothetical protein
MKRRWMLAVLVMGAACQTTTESQTTQALGDPCGAQMPPAPVWDGTAPPLAGAGQLYIVFKPENGYSLAALVDYENAKVPYARQVPSYKRNSFIASTQSNYAQIVTGGNPPPPPDVIDPSLVGAYLVASAQRYADVPVQAAGDVASCKQ